MQGSFSSHFSADGFLGHLAAPGISWCAGILIGVGFGFCAGTPLSSAMRLTASGQVSVVGLMCSRLLPFLLVYMGISLGKPWLVWVFCFFRAMLYGFCAYGVSAAFGSAGWLVSGLLLGSDALAAAALFWLCLHHGRNNRPYLARNTIFCAALASGGGILDALWIAPFLAGILST